MVSQPSLPRNVTAREAVRFYLLDHSTPIGKAIDIAMLSLNLLFIAVFVVETYPHTAPTDALLWRLEVGIAGVFLAEYVLRIYGAADRLGELTNPYTVIDLLSVLPTLSVLVLPGPVTFELGFLRVARIVRVLRFYRFTQDEEFFFGTVEAQTLRAGELVLTIFVLLFATAGLFYSAEHAVNPGVSTFGDAFYYTVVSLTTVGFGDITPVTTGGRWVTVGAILAGIILIPWQAGRIVREWTSRDKIDVTCPNCGLRHHDADASHCKACGHVIYQEYDA